MKKYITYIGIWMISWMNITLYAQSDMDGSRGERIAELRRAFVAERLALTAEQDQQFWPVYDNYVAERKNIQKKIRKHQLLIDNGGLTELELKKSIDEMTVQRKLEADLDAQFIKNAIPIIGVDKASQLTMMEREFKKTMLRKIREKRQMRK